MLALVRLRVLTADRLRRNRRMGIFLVAVVAVLLPTVDPISLALEIVPLLLLFELPMFILGMVRLVILSSSRLRRNRRFGLGICIIGFVLLSGVEFVSMSLQALIVVIIFYESI